MVTASKKRKRTIHTLEMKLEIVKALEKGDSQRLVGQKYGIAKTTIADIWRDRKRITDSVASSESPAFANRKRCVIHHPKFYLVDEACWKWGFASSTPRVLLFLACCFRRRCARSLRSFIPMLIHRASRAAQDGYQRFNTHHGIKNVQQRGEILSSDVSTIDPFRKECSELRAYLN